MVYLINNFVIIFFTYIFKRIKDADLSKLFLFICFVNLTLLIGLRNAVGADFFSYLKIYQHLQGIRISEFTYYPVEKGYELLNIILGKINAPYFILNIIVAGITNFFVIKALQQLNIDVYLGLFLYISLFFFYHSMNQTRQGLAMAIGLFAISQLNKGKNVKFIIYIVIAMLFHTIAVVYFPLLIIKQIDFTPKICLIYLIIGVLGIIFFPEICSLLKYTKYGLYFDSVYNVQFSTGALINTGIRFLLLLYVLLEYFQSNQYVFDRMFTKNKANICLFYHMAIITTIVQFMTLLSTVFGRVTTPFFLSYIVIFSSIVERKKMNYRYIVWFVAGLYQMAYYAMKGKSVLINDYSIINFFN